MRDLISLADVSTEEIYEILNLASELKAEWKEGGNKPLLKGKTLGMIFQKPSLRTRVSFEMGMVHLGGQAIYLSPDEVRLGVRESVADVARVLSRYVNGILARVFSHDHVVELAREASVPVINGLSDFTHPCQGLSDLFTIREVRNTLTGLKLAYVGDGNNVSHSLLFGASLVGMNIAVATPQGYEPSAEVVAKAREFAKKSGSVVELTHDPEQAVRGADIVYTDVWASMGQEAERDRRLKIFPPYQINARLLAASGSDPLVMHCLPAHRGEEITNEVIESSNSIVYLQAENRMHLQKAILVILLG